MILIKEEFLGVGITHYSFHKIKTIVNIKIFR